MSHGPYYLVGCKCKRCKKYLKEHTIAHPSKNIAIVPFSEMSKCGRMDAKHFISGEHERKCSKKRLKA